LKQEKKELVAATMVDGGWPREGSGWGGGQSRRGEGEEDRSSQRTLRQLWTSGITGLWETEALVYGCVDVGFFGCLVRVADGKF
jgi:hypothetical protein